MCKRKLFHDWDKWKQERIGDLVIKEINVGYYMVQWRVCKRCGKKQIERINF